ncbi:hypothetical protein GCM10020367_37870 [Streptomyces sannanensis]|uniref:Uncharacterized protein n=1 Tax=Streptomyces sannanensis TaxID=285536 RepID=A0ABP6SE93_9ACTN
MCGAPEVARVRVDADGTEQSKHQMNEPGWELDPDDTPESASRVSAASVRPRLPHGRAGRPEDP